MWAPSAECDVQNLGAPNGPIILLRVEKSLRDWPYSLSPDPRDSQNEADEETNYAIAD
jgi:hypothetical protein